MCNQDKGRVCSDIRTRLFISRNTYVPYLFHGILIKLQLKFRLIFQFVVAVVYLTEQSFNDDGWDGNLIQYSKGELNKVLYTLFSVYKGDEGGIVNLVQFKRGYKISFNKLQRIPKWQLKIDNPKKLATQGTQYEEKQNKNTTPYVQDTTIRKQPQIM